MSATVHQMPGPPAPYVRDVVVGREPEPEGCGVTRCSSCLGTGEDWIAAPNGTRWTVRNLKIEENGRARCAYCRRHDLTAADFGHNP